MKDMNLKAWRVFFDAIEELAKNRTVTEKFKTIDPALKLCKKFAEENGGKVSVEYYITNVTFTIESLSFSISYFNMPEYRKLIEMVDTIEILPLIDDNVQIIFEIKDVFELPHKKQNAK